MGITKDGLLKRRKTGGKPAKYMKKRKHAMGRPPANTKLAESRVHLIRCRGGYIKHRALRLDSGNYAWGSEGITRKARILSVVYNPTNNEFVRTNTLVKGEIVQVDATPFKLWYETYYGIAIGKKVVVKHDRRQSSSKRDSTKRVSVKKSADDKDAKPAATKKDVKPAAAKKDAKPAAKSVAKSAAKPAEKKEETGKGPTKTINKAINKVKGAKKAAGRKAALIVKKAKAAATRKAKKDAALVVAAKKKTDGKDDKKDSKKVKAEDKKSSVGPIAARHTTAIAGAAAGTLTGTQIDQGKSQIVRDKHAKRAAKRVIEPIFEEQFASGRLLACISSRPGQHGAADGYLLEGRELEFYLRKTGKGRRSAK